MKNRLITVAFAASSLVTAPALMAQPVGFPAPPPKVSPAQGAIDFHVHSDPDVFGRSMDDIDVAVLAKRKGMRGLVLKNHVTMTADRAALAMKAVPGIEIFGGIVLNNAVGGINPAAVEWMHRMAGGRGKVVWLPTFDSDKHIKMGAYIEYCYLQSMTGPDAQHAWMKHWSKVSLKDVAKVVGDIGAQHVVLSSDLGQHAMMTHPDGMEDMITGLLKEGVSQADIDLMVKKNPARLLGLED